MAPSGQTGCDIGPPRAGAERAGGSGCGGRDRGAQLAPPAGEELRLVHAEHGDRPGVPLVDGDEAALPGVAVDDPHGVAVLAVPGELDADAVLVGPEVGDVRT